MACHGIGAEIAAYVSLSSPWGLPPGRPSPAEVLPVEVPEASSDMGSSPPDCSSSAPQLIAVPADHQGAKTVDTVASRGRI